MTKGVYSMDDKKQLEYMEKKFDYLYERILRDQKKVNEAGAIVVYCLSGAVACIILALIFN